MSVTKKWNQGTVGHLISYNNDSESDNPPPDPPPPPPHTPNLTLHSHLTSILRLHGHLKSFLYLHSTQSSHVNALPARRARSSQVNPALANWHSIESAMCLTSKTSIQPRDRAGLLCKQSAHTDPNLIRIRQPDTRY